MLVYAFIMAFRCCAEYAWSPRSRICSKASFYFRTKIEWNISEMIVIILKKSANSSEEAKFACSISSRTGLLNSKQINSRSNPSTFKIKNSHASLFSIVSNSRFLKNESIFSNLTDFTISMNHSHFILIRRKVRFLLRMKVRVLIISVNNVCRLFQMRRQRKERLSESVEGEGDSRIYFGMRWFCN